MTDPFKDHQTALTSPARNGFSVVPDDGTDLPVNCRSLFIGGEGDLSAILVGDSSSIIFKNIPQGTILPVSVKRVLSSLTTATEIVGLY
ncbi:MAG: hypothetical protein F3745_03625 [Nitrospinae bacterium]|nr:hypothetical protein [Nitrospinota bacterium]